MAIKLSDLPFSVRNRVLDQMITKRNKHNAQLTERIVNGKRVKFDSLAEAKYYDKLFAQLRAGLINDLKLQPKFKIADKFKIKTNKTKQGYSIFSEAYYTPDFEYIDKNGDKVIVEVKGQETEAFKLRMRLFLNSDEVKKHNIKYYILAKVDREILYTLL